MASIYIIDDHPMFCDGLRALLQPAGHVVVGDCAEPSAALADVRRLRPDVVILDLGLGIRSGFELLEMIRSRALPCKVVVLTMSNRPRHVADAVRHGVDAYILKGRRASELLVAIEQVMSGERFYSEGVEALLVQALAVPEDAQALSTLSIRERQVIALVVQGKTSREIGELLHLSSKTVDTYRSRLMTKIGTPDLESLLRFALRNGLIDQGEL